MSTQTYRMHRGRAFFFLASQLGIVCLVACSAREDTPGERIGHPMVAPSPPATVITAGPELPTPAPSSSAEEGFGRWPSLPPPWPSAPALGGVTQLEPLSKNVPVRVCRADAQCGDGFCDRGRCAAIWTLPRPYGVRIQDLRPSQSCDQYIPLDGRCRSCVSDPECKKVMGNDAYCASPDPGWGQGRGCQSDVVVPSIIGSTPAPPPPTSIPAKP